MVITNYERVGKALELLRAGLGPFVDREIKAAIAACHMQGTAVDWLQIVQLYDSLLRWEPSPVVVLNRAAALAEAGALAEALTALMELEDALADYQPFHAAKAELL